MQYRSPNFTTAMYGTKDLVQTHDTGNCTARPHFACALRCRCSSAPSAHSARLGEMTILQHASFPLPSDCIRETKPVFDYSARWATRDRRFVHPLHLFTNTLTHTYADMNGRISGICVMNRRPSGQRLWWVCPGENVSYASVSCGASLPRTTAQEREFGKCKQPVGP